MEKYSERLRHAIHTSIEAKQRFLINKEQMQNFGKAVHAIVEVYKNGGRLYIAGNGGSAADAQHLAAEFVSKLAMHRQPLPAEALTVDTSILTAIGNDYGYDEVFARQIAGKMTKKDIFLGLTTSGKSKNIIRALEQCSSMQIPTVIFTGFSGGMVKEICDYCVIAEGNETSSIQELHIVLAHTLCASVEAELFPS